jgi:transcriptional regulator with XRE-family HTH domain
MSTDTNLRAVRKGAGMTLATAARAVGSSEANLSRIERGQQNPPASLLTALLRTYGHPLADELSSLLTPA